ncbi:MAG: pyruvate kinase [Bacilli bacterium]|nr:pyruvate kinase [Bacilli bacterium]
MNKTKMIGTLGPSSCTYEVIRDMIISGVDVIRINMAYASFGFARDAILNVRKINLEYGLETGIMLDTRGPDIRIGGLIKPNIKLEKNKMVRLVYGDIIGDSDIIPVPYKEIIVHSKIGDEIYLNNAEIKLEVINKDEETLICSIKNDGIIKPDSTINIPNVNLNMKFLSNYDKEVIRFAVMMQVDYLALSHVKEELDVLDVNDVLIGLNDNNIELISKIENKQALEEIDKILKVSDGIIIARGDLGIELGIEKVPGIQKKLTKLANEKEKICIIATEMLATMEENSKPTRAEVSDVANAVLDKTDALMLGKETANGNYPVETVKIMNKIIDEIESDIDYNNLLLEISRNENINISKAIAYSSVDSANRVKASAIVCSTLSGATAKDISNYRPSCPVVAVSPNAKVVRGLSINYGIVPLSVGLAETTDELVEISLEATKRLLKLKSGDKVVIVGSFPLESVNYTNFMKIEEVK